MALSGSLNSSKYDVRYIKLSWTATQNISKNESTISWTLKGAGGDEYSWYMAGGFKVVINGVTLYSKDTDYRIKLFNGTTVASGTTTIQHNSDGTKTFSASIQAGIYKYAVNCKGSDTFTLDTIPRASSITATSANVESNSTITINRASSDFTHTLTYTFGSLSGTIATKTTSTSVQFKLPTSFYAQIGSTATSKTGTITCDTYNGDTKIGTDACEFTAKTSSSLCTPTLSPTAIDSNATTVALTGDNNKFVRYFSNASVSTGAAARNSATLTSQKIASGTINKVESASFNFIATDSRGYTTNRAVNKTLINYVKLTCTLKANITVDGVANLTATGKCFNDTFGATYNSFNVQYRYKKAEDSTYTSWMSADSVRYSGTSYTATTQITGLDYKEKYNVQMRIADKLDTVNSSVLTITALPVFDWGENDFNFNVPITVNHNGYSYNLLGLLHAMTTTYELDCDVTLGANYTSGTATAHLVGSNLRIGMSASRNEAVNVGNITNETVMTIVVNHGGKLSNLYRVSFNSSTEGGAATFDAQASKVDDENVKITINLCATTTAATAYNGYFAMPCTIITKAYV